MQSQFIRRAACLLAILVAISFCLIDADAQTRRKRRSRRVVRPVITNPVITPADEEKATASGDRIISTADENQDEQADRTTQTGENNPKNGKTPKAAGGDQDTQETINNLSNQVKKLNDKLGQIQETDQTLMDMERLSRAEQRAENLRSQQVEVESKLADLASKLEDTEYQMKPENIEREMATYGSTRPEVARDARRRKLEGDRNRLLAQIKILETSRVRLEGAVTTADAEVDLLRRRIETRRAQESTSLEPTVPPSSNDRPKPE